MKTETRLVNLEDTGFEVRASDDGGDGVTLVGYGARFDSLSQDLGGFREKIDPTAFNRTLKNQKDILITLNHNVDQLLGRTAAGTARVAVDDFGLRYEVDLPGTSTGRDVEILTQRGDLFGSSFTFSLPEAGDSWERVDGEAIRTLNEVRLHELGPVASPAYLDTTVAVRSFGELVAAEESESEVSAEISEGDETRETTLSPNAVLLRFKR